MPKHLQREIDRLKKQILTLSAIVEKSVREAVKAVSEQDSALAMRVIEADQEIDRIEVDVEEECLKVLALHQPVAIDLRFLVAVLKINNDLERIGDLAVNVAERAQVLARQGAGLAPFDINTMAERTQWMLRTSLDALVNMDSATACEVFKADDTVDAILGHAFEKAKEIINKDASRIDIVINQLSIARHIERIADHATNIAEDVIYMVEGDIVRHGRNVSYPRGKQSDAE
jgi:phosphate transport system protein